MAYRLAPKLVTSNDLERRNGPYFALLHGKFLKPSTSTWLKADPYRLRRKCTLKNLVLGNDLQRYLNRLPKMSALATGTPLSTAII